MARTRLLDPNRRPITAGGFADSGPAVFQDITQRSGLSVWSHKMGTPEKSFIIETVGSGVGLIDYDKDGWLDIYLVNGSTYDAVKGRAESPTPHCSITITMALSPTSQRGRGHKRPLGLRCSDCGLQ